MMTGFLVVVRFRCLRRLMLVPAGSLLMMTGSLVVTSHRFPRHRASLYLLKRRFLRHTMRRRLRPLRLERCRHRQLKRRCLRLPQVIQSARTQGVRQPRQVRQASHREPQPRRGGPCR